MRILRHREDVRSITFVMATLALLGIQWGGVARHPAMYVAGLGMTFIACVINHNHHHCAIFIPQTLNRVLGCLLTLAVGQSASSIVPMHNANHHVHNGGELDLIRPGLVRFRWNLLNLLFFPVAAMASFLAAKRDALKAWKEEQPAYYRQLLTERTVLYVAIVSLAVLRPTATLLYILLPWAFGQWGIIAINHVQHDGCDPDSSLGHSRDFVRRWLNWWLFNNGFHTAHHLQPGLHWSLLPEYHRSLRKKLPAGREQSSLGWYLVRAYLFGRRPQTGRGTV